MHHNWVVHQSDTNKYPMLNHDVCLHTLAALDPLDSWMRLRNMRIKRRSRPSIIW